MRILCWPKKLVGQRVDETVGNLNAGISSAMLAVESLIKDE
jgi:hypothetical protein